MATLFIYPERYAIVSLSPDAPLPTPPASGFYTCMRDRNETTLVLPETQVPAGALRAEAGYRVIMLDDQFPFDVVGVLARCSTALAAAGIPILAYSSYKTDSFLIKQERVEEARRLLEELTFTP